MQSVSGQRLFLRFDGRFGVRPIRLMMILCLLEVVPAFLLIMNYLGVPLLGLVNVNQLVIFVGIFFLTRKYSTRANGYVGFSFLILLISLAKAFLVTGPIDYNFEPGAIFTYFYSLLMPTIILVSVFSQSDVCADEILINLRWFSKWFLRFASLFIISYVFLNLSGRISYFGFGMNFHYAIPYFFQKNGIVAFFAMLILLSGKRAVLINFILQYGLWMMGRFRRSPMPVIIVFLVVALTLVLSWDTVAYLLRRFINMYNVLATADLSNGLLSLSNSYEAIVLFGGRLEEVVGVFDYFSKHPWEIWFGSPPGANYVWRVDFSDLDTVKSFAHLTWLGYTFRFGVLPTALLLGFFIFRIFRDWDTENPLWLVFVGIVTSATFGGNLFYSPVAWAMIAFYLKFGPEVSQEIRREKESRAASSINARSKIS